MQPYSTRYIKVNGHFDHPDRLFHSLAAQWFNVETDAQCNTELIPELFYNPEMLRNNNKCDFGQTQNDIRVHDSILP